MEQLVLVVVELSRFVDVEVSSPAITDESLFELSIFYSEGLWDWFQTHNGLFVDTIVNVFEFFSSDVDRKLLDFSIIGEDYWNSVFGKAFVAVQVLKNVLQFLRMRENAQFCLSIAIIYLFATMSIFCTIEIQRVSEFTIYTVIFNIKIVYFAIRSNSSVIIEGVFFGIAILSALKTSMSDSRHFALGKRISLLEILDIRIEHCYVSSLAFQANIILIIQVSCMSQCFGGHSTTPISSHTVTLIDHNSFCSLLVVCHQHSRTLLNTSQFISSRIIPTLAYLALSLIIVQVVYLTFCNGISSDTIQLHLRFFKAHGSICTECKGNGVLFTVSTRECIGSSTFVYFLTILHLKVERKFACIVDQ